MAPKAKAKKLVVPSPSRRVDPEDERISDTGLTLLDAIAKAEAEGLSRLRPSGGAPEHTMTPEYLTNLLREPETIRQIVELVRQYGMTKFLPLARGAESSVFNTNAGRVLKLGPQDRRFFDNVEPYDYVPPTGVWGVLPATRDHIPGQDHLTAGGNPWNYDWNIWTQPRVITKGVDRRDVGYLTDALSEQGYKWDDNHEQNMGFLPGAGYNPVVIDGPVLQRPGKFNADGTFEMPSAFGGPPIVLSGKNFKPPSVRPWLLAALSAGGAGAMSLANPTAAVAGEDDTQPQFVGNTLRMPPQQAGVIPLAMGSSGAIAPAQPPAPDPRPAPANIFERILGTDLDSSNISPRELDRWYFDPEYGYGGEEHKQYIANAERVMDMPVIPARAVTRLIGGLTNLPKQDAYSVRQIMEYAPLIAEVRAQADYLRDPENPEKQRIYDEIQQANMSGGQGTLPREVYNAFTAQYHDTSSPHVANVVDELLGAVRSGTRGGRFEDDPSISKADFEKLQAQYGEDANRMLTPGGVNNAKREMVFDFLSAAQSGQHLNPQFDNTAYLMSIVAPGPSRLGDYSKGEKTRDRYEFLQDSSALRGRMGLANWRLGQAMPSFEAYEANPEKPYVVEAKNFNRLDPGTYQGIMALSENASWPYARNVYYPFQSFVGMPGERFALAENLLDTDPLRFQVDVANRSNRETPIRLDGEDYASNRATRTFVQDRLAAAADYLPTHARPAIADTVNAAGRAISNVIPNNAKPMSRKPLGFERTAYAMPYAIATSPPNALSMGVGAAGKTVLPVLGGLLKEGIEESVEDFLVDPGNSAPFSQAGGSAWMRPMPPGSMVPDESGGMRRRTEDEYLAMFDPDNKAAWDRGVEETKKRRADELQDQYRQWQQRSR